MPTAESVHDATNHGAPGFRYAISLRAALEGATELDGHSAALPYLGMARAELCDFGQRRTDRYVPVVVSDKPSGLAELDERLTTMLAESDVPQHRLRIEAALKLLLRASRSEHGPR